MVSSQLISDALKKVYMDFHPAYASRELFTELIADPLNFFGPVTSPFSRIPYGDDPNDVEAMRSEYVSRLTCEYCAQQNTIENFDGGCKNCGAPAPRK